MPILASVILRRVVRHSNEVGADFFSIELNEGLTTMEYTPRFPSQDEIVNRIEATRNVDMFGFEWQEYVTALDFEHARPYLKEDVTSEAWKQGFTDVESVMATMKDYVEFAFDKAREQRGLSAERSISHYKAWCWLIGDTEMSEELERGYSGYGIPQLTRLCARYGWEIPE